MKGALEVAYQRALHKGIIDMSLDGELIASFMLPKDTPFRETSMGGMADGVEYALDHSSHGDLIVPAENTKFSRTPSSSAVAYQRSSVSRFWLQPIRPELYPATAGVRPVQQMSALRLHQLPSPDRSGGASAASPCSAS